MPLLSSLDLSAVPVVSIGFAFLKQIKLLTSTDTPASSGFPTRLFVPSAGVFWASVWCWQEREGGGTPHSSGGPTLEYLPPRAICKAAGSQTSVRRWRIGVFSGKGKGLAIDDDKQKHVAKYGISIELGGGRRRKKGGSALQEVRIVSVYNFVSVCVSTDACTHSTCVVRGHLFRVLLTLTSLRCCPLVVFVLVKLLQTRWAGLSASSGFSCLCLHSFLGVQE